MRPIADPARVMHVPTGRDLARYIDHTVLKPDAGLREIERCCNEALTHGFAAVCVNGVHVPAVARLLSGSRVAACAVIGFPLGAMSTRAKVAEAHDVIESGAREVDMVLDIGSLKDNDPATVGRDIAAVRQACAGVVLKVILETCLLTDAEKRLACQIAQDAGVDFVKTSTGFGAAGATVADVAMMRSWVGDAMGVKASGGVRTPEDAQRMIAAGASRIGASASVAIIACQQFSQEG